MTTTAHIAGIPIEETIATLLLAVGAATANVRARLCLRTVKRAREDSDL